MFMYNYVIYSKTKQGYTLYEQTNLNLNKNKIELWHNKKTTTTPNSNQNYWLDHLLYGGNLYLWVESRACMYILHHYFLLRY